MYKILVLDGGGSKGIFTLGILKELEKEIGSKLYLHFDLIYGTSTGSIIASLLGLGYSIDEIIDLYYDMIPKVMNESTAKGKSAKLKILADNFFGDKKFNSFLVPVCIVALNYETQLPFIFKSDIANAHGMKKSFIEGFGCTISDAIQASSAAYPIFNFKVLETVNYGRVTAIDGGFIANNASLYALIDADKALGLKVSEITLLNIGTGDFVDKPVSWTMKILQKVKFVDFIGKLINASSNTNSILTKLLYPSADILRINGAFTEIKYSTNMVEKDKDTLKMIESLGKRTYQNNEDKIIKLLKK